MGMNSGFGTCSLSNVYGDTEKYFDEVGPIKPLGGGIETASVRDKASAIDAVTLHDLVARAMMMLTSSISWLHLRRTSHTMKSWVCKGSPSKSTKRRTQCLTMSSGRDF